MKGHRTSDTPHVGVPEADGDVYKVQTMENENHSYLTFDRCAQTDLTGDIVSTQPSTMVTLSFYEITNSVQFIDAQCGTRKELVLSLSHNSSASAK